MLNTIHSRNKELYFQEVEFKSGIIQKDKETKVTKGKRKNVQSLKTSTDETEEISRTRMKTQTQITKEAEDESVKKKRTETYRGSE